MYIYIYCAMICTISGSPIESYRTSDFRWMDVPSKTAYGEVSRSFCLFLKVKTKSDNKISQSKARMISAILGVPKNLLTAR